MSWTIYATTVKTRIIVHIHRYKKVVVNKVGNYKLHTIMVNISI